MKEPRLWIQGLVSCSVLALLVWQGPRVADLIPQAETAIADLGVWGPVSFMIGVMILSPVFFPDSVFGFLAGIAFGIAAGTLYLFTAIYLANLAIFASGRTWLCGPILRLAESRPQANAILRSAHRDSTRLTLLLRLVPVNIALVSYVLGAGRFPWKAILVGNLALIPQLFLMVYVGHVARDVATLSARSPEAGALEDVGLLLGLLAVACVVAIVTRMARRAVAELEAQSDGEGAPLAAPDTNGV